MGEKLYEKIYFEGIYARLAKEKILVLEAFFDLLVRRKAKISNLLDLGCGEGEFLNFCSEKGIRGFGIDISAYALEKAKKIKAKFYRQNLGKNKLSFENNEFDAITCFDLLEHLASPDYLLTEAIRVLKPGGIFFMTTPNSSLWFQSFWGLFFPGDKTHVNVQNKKYWQQHLYRAGFKVLEVKGCFLFGFPPSLSLRSYFRQLGLPTTHKPFFLPFIPLTSTLFIFATK